MSISKLLTILKIIDEYHGTIQDMTSGKSTEEIFSISSERFLPNDQKSRGIYQEYCSKLSDLIDEEDSKELLALFLLGRGDFKTAKEAWQAKMDGTKSKFLYQALEKKTASRNIRLGVSKASEEGIIVPLA